jgi:two-component system alkaline phosphatase synthesis response regulator PhoP
MKELAQKKILLVDDDPDIREFMSYNLKKENYLVYTAFDGQSALEKVRSCCPDLVILDIMMRGMNGFEVCKEIRKENKDILVCFLTARGEEYSQIAGFEAGADDYVTKPVQPNVFVKKINALLRRSEFFEAKKNSLKYGDLIIDFESHVVQINGKDVIFPKKEFALLCLLASEPGKVFSREEIYAAVWGSNIIVGDRTIDVHIRKLREKVGEKYITTLKGVGYKFNML